MKTTNNKLLDNTGKPVSHNRPIWNVDKCNCNIYSEKCDYCYSFPNELENYIDKLEKENQELNDLLASAYNKIDFELKDQFLKVVESVFKEHRHSKLPAHPYPCDNCSKCGVILNNPNVKYTLPLWVEHILQEIKSAMEKGNNE